MGAITAAIKKRTVTNSGRVMVVDCGFSGTYATNGDTLPSKAALGLDNSIDYFDAASTSGGYVLSVDYVNGKVKVFRQTAATSALVEVPNATNLTAETFRAIVHGDLPNA